MECWFIDVKQLVSNRLTMDSQQHPLIAVHVGHRYAVVGALAQQLKIQLSDILFGYATMEKMDIVVLTFHDPAEAETAFQRIPKDWVVEGQPVLAQLWEQGKIIAKNSK